MKIVFISPVTPYKENMGGPSGHPYHLMIQRPSDIEITIYSYNQNNLSKEVIKEVENELKISNPRKNKIKLNKMKKEIYFLLNTMVLKFLLVVTIKKMKKFHLVKDILLTFGCT